MGLHDQVQRNVRTPNNGWTRRKGIPFRLNEDERRAVELAAMEQARRRLLEAGYAVADVSEQCLGWDLPATKGKRQLCVEVKGTVAGKWAVELTANEHEAARMHRSHYPLVVVRLESLDRLRPVEVVELADQCESFECEITPLRYLVRPATLEDLNLEAAVTD